MKTFLQYIELVLTAVGLVVVLAVFAVFHNIAPWKAAAICAVAVSVIHGAIFYAVRARQRKGRTQAVFSIRTMLDDLVDSQLAVQLYPSPEVPESWQEKAQRAVFEIQARLNYIEAESLRRKKMN